MREPDPARSSVFGAMVFSAFILFVAPTRAGVINLVSQTRFVDVTTSGSPLGLPPADKRADAPDFGQFNQSVNLSFPPGIGQTASQQSTLTLTPDGNGLTIDAHGSISTQITLNGLPATSHFQVDFNLTQAEPYFLTYNGQEGDPRPTSPKSFVPGSFTGPSAPGTLTGDPHTINYFTTLTYSGTLQPGSYELLAESNATGFASFDMHLAVGTAAVPLPPGFWAAVVALPVLLLALWGFRRSNAA